MRFAFRGLRDRITHEQTNDEERDERLASIRELVEGFTFELALLIAGQDADLESFADSRVALQVRSSLLPFVESGNVIRPDFGAYGELRLDGDLLDDSALIAAKLEFDDRSFRETSEGQLLPSPRRRVQLCMKVTLTPLNVVDLDVHLLN